MAPDVTDGALSGVIDILEKWKKLSIYHEDTLVQLKSLEQVDENSVLAIPMLKLLKNIEDVARVLGKEDSKMF
ncbi:hypothetical protein DVH05_019179 [Phytophthora capsici]|nr:hypothetical protein DVH05_019175 [Phytophthora capsici]KAG1695841.1 hypothetical protein DVH05_019179 [Phytophthora capsici]